jgi:hypothetical protein
MVGGDGQEHAALFGAMRPKKGKVLWRTEAADEPVAFLGTFGERKFEKGLANKPRSQSLGTFVELLRGRSLR